MTNGTMSLCPHVVSQTPQHLRFSQTQTTCDGCFACQSIYSDVSFDSSLSKAVHPQEFSKVDVRHWQFQCGLSIPLFTFVASLLNLWRGWHDRCLLGWSSDSAFPNFLAGVSHRVAGIGLGTFPTPWFAWALSAGLLEVLGPLLDPSKTCSILVCLPLCFSRLHTNHRVGHGFCWWHWSVPWPVPLFSSFYSQYFFEISCSEGDECLKWLTNGPAFLILTFIPCRPGSSCHGGGGGGRYKGLEQDSGHLLCFVGSEEKGDMRWSYCTQEVFLIF